MFQSKKQLILSYKLDNDCAVGAWLLCTFPFTIGLPFCTWIFQICAKHHNRVFFARYRGELDSEGSPHGYGMWEELTDENGERLEGYWSHGVPVAPFVSREVGSASGFQNTRIGFASSRRYYHTVKKKKKENHDDCQTQYGVAACESSVAGRFYRDFPQIIFYPHDLFQQSSDSVVANSLSYLGPTFDSMTSFQLAEVPDESIIQPTSIELLTLLTTLGAPMRQNEEYSNSILVWADPHTQSLQVSDYIPICESLPRKVEISIVAPTREVKKPKEDEEMREMRSSMSTAEETSVTFSQSYIHPSSGDLLDEQIDQWWYAHTKGSPWEQNKQNNTTPNDFKLSVKEWVAASTYNISSPSLLCDELDTALCPRTPKIEEALIFIHGFHCRLTHAVGQLGQLLGYMNLPRSRVVPLVFTWPGDVLGDNPLGALFYQEARRRAEGEEVQACFVQFCQNLQNCGTCHIFLYIFNIFIVF
eukprot:GHVL01020329.1.p1 GENE.GHVL01020329.1~~GHVL01020329.1.p1  ORF type:complete len:474 (-),score=71.90 GHVL01020329.1:11-1432(-)